VQEGFDTIILE